MAIVIHLMETENDHQGVLLYGMNEQGRGKEFHNLKLSFFFCSATQYGHQEYMYFRFILFA